MTVPAGLVLATILMCPAAQNSCEEHSGIAVERKACGTSWQAWRGDLGPGRIIPRCVKP